MFKADWRHIGIIFGLAVVLFGYGIGGYDVWPADEPRFAQVGREMLQSGEYVHLTVNGEPYTEKPPLLFWMMAGFGHYFGDVNETAARLPSVIAGVAGVLFTYGLGARMFGARTGLWAAFILMTTFRFWWQARTAQTDMLVAGSLAGVMYCLWRWDVDRRRGWQWAALVLLVAALYAKGPPALVFFVLGIWSFYWGEPYSRRQTHWLRTVLVALALVAVWFAPARMLGHDGASDGPQVGMGENIFRNTIGRMFLGTSKVQPPWYYLTTIPADLMPWTLFLPWAVAKAWRERRDNRAMSFLLAWSVPALIFFSISIGKRATYILPLFPIFGILLSRGVLAFMDEAENPWRRRLTHWWAAGLLALGLVLFAAPFIEVQGQRLPSELAGCVYLFAGLQVCQGAYAFLRGKYAARSPLHRVIFVQMAILLVAAVAAIFPVINVFQSARAFCAPLRGLSERSETYQLYSLGFTREAYIYCAKHPHTALFTELIGVDDLQGKELFAAAKAQKNAKNAIQDAVDAVPVANIASVTSDELAALRGAIESSEAAADDAARQFESHLRMALDDFAAKFSTFEPSFFFVQDDDWRWILPMQSKPPAYHVVQQQRVGSREVLLIANDAGEALLARGSGA